ncbi:hypothetical protein ACA910_006538 [Epithemia clementina (nom. ined.)]
MGQSPSPYATIQVFGNKDDTGNVFHWKQVKLNLPGTLGYQPRVPWISKRCNNGIIAADMQGYVDDMRGTAPAEEEAWQAGLTIAKTASHYGIQDAMGHCTAMFLCIGDPVKMGPHEDGDSLAVL